MFVAAGSYNFDKGFDVLVQLIFIYAFVGHHPAGYGAFEIMKIAHGGESTTLENVQHVRNL